jgi:hypothetical protein
MIDKLSGNTRIYSINSMSHGDNSNDDLKSNGNVNFYSLIVK